MVVAAGFGGNFRFTYDSDTYGCLNRQELAEQIVLEFQIHSNIFHELRGLDLNQRRKNLYDFLNAKLPLPEPMEHNELEMLVSDILSKLDLIMH